MPVADEQVRIIMRERSKGRSQEQAVAKANVKSRQTVAKYEQLVANTIFPTRVGVSQNRELDHFTLISSSSDAPRRG